MFIAHCVITENFAVESLVGLGWALKLRLLITKFGIILRTSFFLDFNKFFKGHFRKKM